MMQIKLKKGLNIPLWEQLDQSIQPMRATQKAALLVAPFHGLKPGLLVQSGDAVYKGQALLHDKQYPDVCYTAPVSGVVESINRGQRRKLISITLKAQAVAAPAQEWEQFTQRDIASLKPQKIREILLKTGLWTTLRTRPYSKVPDPATQPHSIFVNAMDTRPLAPHPGIVIAQNKDAFCNGVQVLSRINDGTVFVCTAPHTDLPLPDVRNISVARFEGPHPAGLAGTHVHCLDPVHEHKIVWTIPYQSVISIGQLFGTGELSFERIISVAGPLVEQPCLIRTHVGACVSELCATQVRPHNCRLIAGSVLDGWTAEAVLDFLGQDTVQISALEEHASSQVLGWLRPLTQSFSLSRAVSWFSSGKSLQFNCRMNGSERAFIPLGLYEQVFPLKMLVAPLLRSLLVMDTEMSKKLGCLELDEEDLALCSYVCPSKHEFGFILRAVLERIEKEG